MQVSSIDVQRDASAFGFFAMALGVRGAPACHLKGQVITRRSTVTSVCLVVTPRRAGLPGRRWRVSTRTRWEGKCFRLGLNRRFLAKCEGVVEWVWVEVVVIHLDVFPQRGIAFSLTELECLNNLGCASVWGGGDLVHDRLLRGEGGSVGGMQLGAQPYRSPSPLNFLQYGAGPAG